MAEPPWGETKKLVAFKGEPTPRRRFLPLSINLSNMVFKSDCITPISLKL